MYFKSNASRNNFNLPNNIFPIWWNLKLVIEAINDKYICFIWWDIMFMSKGLIFQSSIFRNWVWTCTVLCTVHYATVQVYSTGPCSGCLAQSQNVPGGGRTQDRSQWYHPSPGSPAGSVPLVTSLSGQHQQKVSAGRIKYSEWYF